MNSANMNNYKTGRTMKTGLMAVALVALVGMLGCGSAMAEGGDGNELLRQCQYYIKLADGGAVRTDVHFDAGECSGFVEGVVASTFFYSNDLKKDEKFCVPGTVTYSQSVRVVVKYLKDNPKQLNKSRTGLVWAALKDAYPCK
jgi:hypothetical protein